jgi:3-oxoacyl-[acyl-carrier-protein] synthase II
MKRRVVITGMGALTSVGNTVEETWNALINGKNGIDYIRQFDTTGLKVTVAGEVKNFDPSIVVGAKDARKLDRTILLAICAAQEAYDQSELDNSKIDPYRFGTFVTSGIGGLNTIWEECTTANTRGFDRVSPFFIPNSIVNLVGGHIAIRFKAKGPNLPVVTACSAGTNSIGEAFRYIRDGYLEIAFAGGAEAPLNALGIAGFSNMRALSMTNNPETASIPFDLNRSGFVMAEGAGVLILEEYEHAVNRGAKILAEVVGYGSTTDAYHMTAPDESAEGIDYCMRDAIKDAGIDCNQIGYINAHGTSTVLNDKIETLGIKKTFGEYAYQLNISSTKSMTGHSLGATGAIESIVVVKAIQQGIIPPTIHYSSPDPDCDLNYTPNYAVKRHLEYGMNVNLGFGGQNAAVIFKKVGDLNEIKH